MHNQPYQIDDFTLLTVIGRGAFGKVLLVRKTADQQIYALKIIKKQIIQRQKKTHLVFTERNILVKLEHPFIIHLHASFHNQKKLYFLLEYCPGGDLFSLFNKKQSFTEEQVKFYAAQLLLTLEYMHNLNIIYRDLKPENILIDKDGYIRITDFGLSKIHKNQKTSKKQVFQTDNVQYVAPEFLTHQQSSKMMDYWAFGALIYELITGLPPFYSQNTEEMFQNIKFKPFKILSNKISQSCRTLLQGLFQKSPKKRLGFAGAAELKKHPWFMNIDWDALLQKKYKAPFVPILKNQLDVSYFDSEFTESALESYAESLPSVPFSQAAHMYNNFTYKETIQEQQEKQQNT